jgi:hypothetical protein
MTADQSLPVRSITKSVAIDRDPDAVFDYLADAANWPHWAVANVRSVSPSPQPGWWDMETPRGPGRLHIQGDRRFGILDHDFVNDEAHWTVPARVVRNGRGAEFMMTFYQPPALSDATFDGLIALVGDELATLKRILEAERKQSAPA